MPQHSWKRLELVPGYFGTAFAIGVFVPYIIALVNHRVTPFVPYISEGGGHFPEAGIFSMCIVLTGFLSQSILTFRHLVVEGKNDEEKNDLTAFLNKMSTVLGSLSTVSLIVVASYPTTSISQVHNSAAGVASICLILYITSHVWISFRLQEDPKVAGIRLAIAVCSVIALILVACFGVLGSFQWTADYWTGRKTPGDKGFLYYVLSASAEWILAVLIFLFYATYIPEFKRSTFHFCLQVEEKENNKSTWQNGIQHS